MKIYSLETVIEIKRELAEKFGLDLHFHDGCGSQSFSFDAPVNADVADWITAYFGKLGGTVQFSESGAEFVVN